MKFAVFNGIIFGFYMCIREQVLNLTLSCESGGQVCLGNSILRAGHRKINEPIVNIRYKWYEITSNSCSGQRPLSISKVKKETFV